MNNENGNRKQAPPMDNGGMITSKRDKQLMKAAKERVETRGVLKWMLVLGAAIWILQFLLWLFTEDRGNPGGFMVAWGIVMVVLFIVFIPSLLTTGKSDNKKDIMAEYEKLKSRDSSP